MEEGPQHGGREAPRQSGLVSPWVNHSTDHITPVLALRVSTSALPSMLMRQGPSTPELVFTQVSPLRCASPWHSHPLSCNLSPWKPVGRCTVMKRCGERCSADPPAPRPRGSREVEGANTLGEWGGVALSALLWYHLTRAQTTPRFDQAQPE